MTDRQLATIAYRQLKAAARRLVAKAGGLEAAAAVTRVNVSRLGDYQHPEALAFMPADVIADIESDVGDPIVTRELAALAGFDLIERAPGATPGRIDPARSVRLLTVDLGRLTDHFDRAGNDGALSVAERRQLMGDANALIDQARKFIEVCEAGSASGQHPPDRGQS